MRRVALFLFVLLAVSAGRAELRLTQFIGFGSSAPSLPEGGGMELTYSSDGDTNGAIYWIGTNFGAGAFSNPHTSGAVTVVFSSIITGSPAWVVDRAPNSNITPGNSNGEWIAIDLGAGRSVLPKRYSLRQRSQDAVYLMRNWKLQGSNDAAGNSVAQLNAATWVDLDVQSNNTTIAGASQWVSPEVVGASTSYRWLRVVVTGLNSHGQYYFCLAEFEVYGTFYGTP